MILTYDLHLNLVCLFVATFGSAVQKNCNSPSCRIISLLNVIFTAFSVCPEYNSSEVRIACLLQYYGVQCARRITLPSANFEYM